MYWTALRLASFSKYFRRLEAVVIGDGGVVVPGIKVATSSGKAIRGSNSGSGDEAAWWVALKWGMVEMRGDLKMFRQIIDTRYVRREYSQRPWLLSVQVVSQDGVDKAEGSRSARYGGNNGASIPTHLANCIAALVPQGNLSGLSNVFPNKTSLAEIDLRNRPIFRWRELIISTATDRPTAFFLAHLGLE